MIEVTEQDDVAVLRLADGKVNAMSMEFLRNADEPEQQVDAEPYQQEGEHARVLQA